MSERTIDVDTHPQFCGDLVKADVSSTNVEVDERVTPNRETVSETLDWRPERGVESEKQQQIENQEEGTRGKGLLFHL